MVRISLPRLALTGVGLLIAAEAVAQTPAPSVSSASAPAKAGAPLPAASSRPPPAAPPKGSSPKAGLPPPKASPPRSRKAAVAARRKDNDDKAPPTGGPIATAPSFRMLDDGQSRVFLEVSQKVQVTERKARGRVVYQLKGAAVPLRNSRLPLLTGFFATPIGRIELVNQGDGADLVIDLREPAEPTHRLIETPRGMALQVDFPPSAGGRGAGALPRSSGKRIAPRDVPQGE
jgi:hypothetical protein